MPFKSTKQKKLMEIAAHDPEFAKKVGIKQNGAKKLVKEDKQAKQKEAK